MKPPKLLRTVFLRAIKVLEKRGWYQGGLFGEPGPLTGPCCMVGACNVASTGDPRQSLAHVLDVLGDVVGTHFIGEWNDRELRGEREVFAALRKAAKAAGNQRVTP